MSVRFDHPAHVATMWLPQLTPTTATVISTCLGLLVAAVIIGAVGALFTSVCLERPRPMRHGAGFALALLALVLTVPAMRQHIWGPSAVSGAQTSPARADAESAAASAAHPRGAWIPSAKATTAPTSTAAPVWADTDLETLSRAVENQEHLQAAFPGARAVVDTSGMSAADIAKSGTSYVTTSGAKQRCVVELKSTTTNNIGQPLTTDIGQVRCAAGSS